MTAHPLALVRYRAFDQNGQPLIGGQVFAYEAGSTTSPKDTYSDRSMGTLNQWPVTLDDAGSAPIYISGDYFFQVFDADGNLIEEGDGIADAESIAQALIEGTSSSAAIIEQRVTDLETARDDHTDQINQLDDDTTSLRTDLNKEVNTDRNAAITAANTALKAEIDQDFTDFTTAVDDTLTAMSVKIVPTGGVLIWCTSTAPTGFLELAGQAISRTTYAALFSVLGTAYGVGDGSTTFNLPDLRGEFVRGWDHGRGIDASRTMGSHQDDAIQNIVGSLKADNVSDGNSQFIDNLQVDGAFGVVAGNKTYTGDGGGGSGQAWGADFDASRVVRTSSETRPRNLALMYIIKT